MPDDRRVAGPRPYEGPDERRMRQLGRCHQQRGYGPDHTDEICYAFHELGFRGPSFDPDAPLRVLVAGESDAFGLGVAWQHAWPVRVVERLRRQLGLGAGDVALLNIADCGIGNEAIARQLLCQCEAVRPDLVLVNVAEHRRTEGLCDGQWYHVGPWFDHDEAPAEVERMAARRGDDWPRRVFAGGHHYLQFSDPQHDLLASLRALLWMQEHLLRRGVPAFATCRPEQLPDVGARRGHALEPLLALLDRDFLQTHGERHARTERGADGVHFGEGVHERIADSVWQRIVAAGADDRLRAVVGERRGAGAVGRSVRSFYDVMPFNLHGSVASAARSIREHDLAASHPDLHAHLRDAAVGHMVELGCGAGWLACTVAHHYGVDVTAVDFTPKALERAALVARALGVEHRVQFVESDLHAFAAEPCDLVVSVGVLHHTEDAGAAFAHVQQLVAPGGAIYVGLYHEPGRRPFLEHFAALVAEQGENAAFAQYRALDGVRGGDEVLARSWFRDQVLHPHESCHTLREVCGWFAKAGLRLRSTSINRFGPCDDEDALFALEHDYERRSRRALLEHGRYFPGFFTALAVRERTA
ncbi:MAG: methyltransferase domain-containing protein [Planctomycetota bacterium]